MQGTGDMSSACDQPVCSDCRSFLLKRFVVKLEPSPASFMSPAAAFLPGHPHPHHCHNQAHNHAHL